MTENWIHTEKQNVLTLGDSDITVTIPHHQLEWYSPDNREGEPIQLPTGVYRASGWTEVDGDPNRVTVKLIRDKFVCKPDDVKLPGMSNIDWRLFDKVERAEPVKLTRKAVDAMKIASAKAYINNLPPSKPEDYIEVD